MQGLSTFHSIFMTKSEVGQITQNNQVMKDEYNVLSALFLFLVCLKIRQKKYLSVCQFTRNTKKSEPFSLIDIHMHTFHLNVVDVRIELTTCLRKFLKQHIFNFDQQNTRLIHLQANLKKKKTQNRTVF